MSTDDSRDKTLRVQGLDHRNPVRVLHETHTGRVKVRDRLGYEFRVDKSEVTP